MIGEDSELTPSRLLTVLKAKGLPVTDAANGVTTPRIVAPDAVQAVDRVDQVTCTENCRQDCDAGYEFGGSTCDPVCGDGRVVDGEECDGGGLCVGGGNPGAVCLVNGPAVCTGGGVCQPRGQVNPSYGCDATCQCNAANVVCGDGHRCGSEACDVGKHCDSGSNFNALCTDVPAICTAGGGNCVVGDWVKLCNDVDHKAQDCSQDATLCDPDNACTVYGGYCTSSCTVRQPLAFPY